MTYGEYQEQQYEKGALFDNIPKRKGTNMTPEQAKAICIEAHKGQFRRDGITPFVEHPIAVADMMTTDEEKIISLFHDILEDTNVTYQYLYDEGLWELSDTARNALKLLTKQPDQSYELYIFNISCCKFARKIKIADITHNLSSNPTDSQKCKYQQAMKILLATL